MKNSHENALKWDMKFNGFLRWRKIYLAKISEEKCLKLEKGVSLKTAKISDLKNLFKLFKLELIKADFPSFYHCNLVNNHWVFSTPGKIAKLKLLFNQTVSILGVF